MNFEKWISMREEEREFAYANGLNNGDPQTNGEYRCTDFFLSHGINTFYDVGANKGIFTKRVLEKHPEVSVYAFEPNPIHAETFDTLKKTNKLLHFHPVAIGDQTGEVEFHRHPQYHETSSLSKRSLMTSKFQNQMERIRVKITKLDDFQGSHANIFLKIDTEGHEFPALRGAQKTIRAAEKVVILFEYSFGWQEADEDIRDCFQYLNSEGYNFYRLLPEGLEEIRFITSDMADIQYCNYIVTKGFAFSDEKTTDIPSPYGSNRLIRF